MKRLRQLVRRLARRQRGQDLLEYALLAALDLGAGWEFDGGWSVGAGYGRQWVSGYGGELDYDYWKLTGGKSFENGFGIGLEWHDTDLAGVDDTVLVSLSKSF